MSTKKNNTTDVWQHMPTWINWIAMDSDGFWFGYCKKPKLDFRPRFVSGWSDDVDGEWVMAIPIDYCPKFLGHWKDSLHKRPQ